MSTTDPVATCTARPVAGVRTTVAAAERHRGQGAQRRGSRTPRPRRRPATPASVPADRTRAAIRIGSGQPHARRVDPDPDRIRIGSDRPHARHVDPDPDRAGTEQAGQADRRRAARRTDASVRADSVSARVHPGRTGGPDRGGRHGAGRSRRATGDGTTLRDWRRAAPRPATRTLAQPRSRTPCSGKDVGTAPAPVATPTTWADAPVGGRGATKRCRSVGEALTKSGRSIGRGTVGTERSDRAGTERSTRNGRTVPRTVA